MEATQSQEGLTLLISLSVLCVIILIAAYSLTFVRKADTSDHKHH